MTSKNEQLSYRLSQWTFAHCWQIDGPIQKQPGKGAIRAKMREVTAFNRNSKETARLESLGHKPKVTRQQKRHEERRFYKQPLNVSQEEWHRENGFSKVHRKVRYAT